MGRILFCWAFIGIGCMRAGTERSPNACESDDACVSAPTAVCVSEQAARRYESPGVCTFGRCTYSPTDSACAFGCLNGACAADPCEGVQCLTPPAPTCVNASVRRSFDAVGECRGGTCTYAESTPSCSVCEAGRHGQCLWNDASLANLAIHPGTVVFHAAQSTYVVTVPHWTTNVEVTATLPAKARATLTINGRPTISGASLGVAFEKGVASATVVVTAEGGMQNTYRLILTAGNGFHAQQAYLKASNAKGVAWFGNSMAVSADGNTLAVGSVSESSGASGINGNQQSTTAPKSGAVYVFVRRGSTWTQEAYVKASNTGAGDWFGMSVALSADGNTLAVGAFHESSGAVGINGDQFNDAESHSGAVYVFSRIGGAWAQTAYVKSSNSRKDAVFGYKVALSEEGNTLAVGGYNEGGGARTVNGDPFDQTRPGSGAVHIFVRTNGVWTQQAYLKASNADSGDHFGESVALSRDGNTVAVGAWNESSSATGVNGNENDNSAYLSGAAYVFVRSGTTWTQAAYVKPSNTGSGDHFGFCVALSGDGSTLIVSSPWESSNAVGFNGDPFNNLANGSGAVYFFALSGSSWAQTAYLKASNTEKDDSFGLRLVLSTDGNTLVVGSTDDSASQGLNGNPLDNSASQAGAAFVFVRQGAAWVQRQYLKASNAEAFDRFGGGLAVSSDGTSIVVGATGEASGAVGNQADNSAPESGAAYVFAL